VNKWFVAGVCGGNHKILDEPWLTKFTKNFTPKQPKTGLALIKAGKQF
jgi:hypothetical protein